MTYSFFCEGCKARPKADGWSQIRDTAIDHLQRCGGKSLQVYEDRNGVAVKSSLIKKFEPERK